MEEFMERAMQKYEAVIRRQLERVENMKKNAEPVDYQKLDKLIIGVCGGDGIGPVITNEAARVLSLIHI